MATNIDKNHSIQLLWSAYLIDIVLKQTLFWLFCYFILVFFIKSPLNTNI